MKTLNSEKHRSIGIRTKMLLGFTTMALLTITTVLVTLGMITHTDNFSKRLVKIDLPLYESLINLNTDIYKSRSSIQSLVITHDKIYLNEFNKTWEIINNKLTAIDGLITNLGNSEYLNKWNNIKTMIDQLNEKQKKIIEATNNGNLALATQIMTNESTPLFKQISLSLNKSDTLNGTELGMLDEKSNELHTEANKILSDLDYLRTIEIILLIISVIASIVIALYMSKRILRPINNAIDIAKKIASGDRNIEVKITSKDETGELLKALDSMQSSIKDSEVQLQKNEAHTRELFESVVRSAKMFSEHSGRVSSGDLSKRLEIDEKIKNSHEVMDELGNDLNKMTDNLSSIAKEITQACHSMVTTLEEVRHAVDSQSSGASEQASSINEITASVSEIEKSTSQTMEKAKALGEAAGRTRERGKQGLDAVEQSVKGMKAVRDKVQIIAETILDLSNQTQQVGEITAVVNNLAQQSKMLALNASIEAAKAGESGKGFAVVASEVKNLAEQSEQSTEQVQKILEDIKRATDKAVMATEEGTKGVDHGTGLVEQTGEIMRGLNAVIHETTIASQQIEAAVRQESAGIEQITAGMNEINLVTSTFVESVKQTTEAMANLSKVAKNLQVYVDTYKI